MFCTTLLHYLEKIPYFVIVGILLINWMTGILPSQLFRDPCQAATRWQHRIIALNLASQPTTVCNKKTACVQLNESSFCYNKTTHYTQASFLQNHYQIE